MIWFPEIVLLIAALVLVLVDCFAPQARHLMGRLAMAGVVAAFAATFTLGTGSDYHWMGMYAVDPLATFFKRFFLVTLFIVLAMSHAPARRMGASANESFILPLFTGIGMMLLASAVDFTILFVGLELVTISFYILVALRRGDRLALEAGVKYLIMGALSTGFLVYGIAFVFGLTGSTSLSGLSHSLTGSAVPSFALLFAAVLILCGFAFKLASVPFHVWAPDVYQGAPSPVTAFLSVGSKAAGLVVLLRVFYFSGFSHPSVVSFLAGSLAVMAGLSVLLGNFAALPQRNLKRLLAYSSIGHGGFLLMGLSCTTPDHYFTERGVQAVLVYLVIYLLSALLAFYIISEHEEDIGGVDLKSYSGLAQRSPFLAFGMLVSFVSLAGIPPLAGFLGKLGIFAALWQVGSYGLLMIGIVSAVAGLYFYLGVVRAMYWNNPEVSQHSISIGGGSKLVIGFLAASVILLGIWQTPIQALVEPVLSQKSIILSGQFGRF